MTIIEKSPRRLTQLPLDKLSVSPLNVRRHGPRDIASLAQSIRAQGLLQPLVARKSGDGFEVIAGSRRLKALQQLAAEDGGTAEPVPCLLIAPGDDAHAIEASLAENIARLPMDEIDQYQAIAALVRQGRSEDTIAEHFGITPLTVRRRLGLARLIPDIHRLYRSGEIEPETLKLLTLATKERQKAYVALLRDPDQPRPPRWQLKAWLLGGAEIETRFALFEEAAYSGDITGDLFGTARYFADHEQFWTLQNAAIAALRDDLAAKGWAQVHVIGPEPRFMQHEWQEVAKSKGGHAVIEVRANGEVEVHKGLLTHTEARAAQKRAVRAAAIPSGEATLSEPGEDAAPDTARPELSQPLANYCDLVRLSTVKAALAKAPGLALRVMLAQMMGGSAHVTAKREPMVAANDATKASIDGLGSATAFAKELERARKLLDLEADESLIGHGYDPERVPRLLAKLLTLTDAQVMAILALVTAETLALGTGLIDQLGTTLKASCADHWKPDDAFFDLIRDREATAALLTEVIGAKAADSYLTLPGTKKKEIIRAALDGKGRPKVKGWLPQWLAFPQQGYTQRPLTARRPSAA